ncbi:GNAT family N-acetyltransferase [Paenibacillus sp. UNC499MF]|uniref:GNAT family N-acetyltransferase n=1 Tax=Paenibacillus sp. UNC499MF TaxID=1502751 RepID=UPI0008A06D02|nr:GNAT family N-acetyltransferase [Paenibacillus sp. UNC499MF]SEG43203.1 Protein N-acetyltransferase, RimJ/RimL family [Paenibacillus sp. UNC499MF]
MIIAERPFNVNGLSYTIRSAAARDAEQLSGLRVQIDGETENLDREPGEAFMDAPGFVKLIEADSDSPGNLFLVAVVQDRIVGYSRCEGNSLKRFSHKVEFGVGVLKDFWGHSIGKNLLKTSIDWADSVGMVKMTLTVLETNEKAVQLYEKLGFEVEGVLRKDKLLSDGIYYGTLVMGRLNE